MSGVDRRHAGAGVTVPADRRAPGAGDLRVPPPAGGSDLPIPEEPTGLRDALRDALYGCGSAAPASAGEARLGRWLWERWSPCLEPAGMGREGVVAQVAGCRWELRLWLAGERTWTHYASGLAGRISRRLPDPGTEPAPAAG